MLRLKRDLSVSALLLASLNAHAQIPSEITMAATDWCPYTCDSASGQKGIAYDFLTEVLKKHGVKLNVRFYPWSRALLVAQKGEVDGLVTATWPEADGMLFTSTPTGSYKVCFFTNKDSSWTYSGVDSLSNVKLGVVSEYVYGEPVDSYLKAHGAGPNVVTMRTPGGVGTLLNMLKHKRFEVTLDDGSVAAWLAKKQGVNVHEFRNAGCMEAIPYTLAVNPKLPWAQELVDLLNKDFALAENRLVYDGILNSYTRDGWIVDQ
jgi:polar amino acid transport system substrate-binding protein